MCVYTVFILITNNQSTQTTKAHNYKQPVVGGFFGHHRNFACPESPASRAEDDLGGEHGLPT